MNEFCLLWPNHLSWDLSILRSSVVKNFWISKHVHLVNDVTPLILRINLILDACTCDRTLSIITQDSYHIKLQYVRMGTKTVLKIENFAIFQQFSFHSNWVVQSSHCCHCLSNSNIQFFVLPSVTCECYPKILELLYLQQCLSIHLQHALIRVSWKMRYISFDFCLCLFILLQCYKQLQTYLKWLKIRFCAARTKTSAHSRQLILLFPIVAHSSFLLHLSIQFM